MKVDSNKKLLSFLYLFALKCYLHSVLNMSVISRSIILPFRPAKRQVMPIKSARSALRCTSLAIGFYKKISTFRFAMLRKFSSLQVVFFSKKPCLPALPAFWLPIAGQMWRFAANVKASGT